MLKEIFTILSLGYVCFTYVSLLDDMMNIWIQFIGTSLTTFVQTIVIYIELQAKYPSIIFDDSNYNPPSELKTIRIILILFFFGNLGFLMYLSFAFVLNSEYPIAVGILQCISVLSLILAVNHFLINGYSNFAGNAYCDYRMFSNNTKIEYCLIPSSLTSEQLEIYKKENRLM